jgi:hydrogenase maturation factor
MICRPPANQAPDPVSAKAIPPGKLPEELLKRLLDLPRHRPPELLIGPAPGEDAALLRSLPGPILVTSDPITFPTPEPGWYAVHINANDIAAMGGKPSYFTLTLILPTGTTEQEVEAIMLQALEASRQLGITLVGGHTEVSSAVNTPIVSVTMFGQLLGESPTKTGGGQIGDALLQINPMGIEGTSITVSENPVLIRRQLGEQILKTAQEALRSPGLSVVAPANLILSKFTVHAMHDPTEGGIATGIREMALCSDTGITVQEEKLLIMPETQDICKCLGLDPLGLVSSGCLLVALPGSEAEAAISFMHRHGYQASQIGILNDQSGTYELVDPAGHKTPLPFFAADELAR